MGKIANVRRLNAFRALWTAVRTGHQPGTPTIADRIRAMPRMTGAAVRGHYPGLGRGRLVLFAAALAYIVSPVDVMPEILLTVFGLGDDAVVALWLAGSFLDETQRYLDWERATNAGQPS